MRGRTRAGGALDWLNHHHLHYFWVVVREGTIARASKLLHVTPQTISAQIRALEEQLGEALFARRGRRLELTATGEVVRRYADEIFTLSQELVADVRGRGGRARQLRVGISDALPKLVCHRLLAPAIRARDPVQLHCREEAVPTLLADLAVHRLDLVLTDAPLPPSVSVRAYNHLLGESRVVWLGARALAGRYKRGFPGSLNGAPMLLPPTDTVLRRSLDLWFERVGVRPKIVGEFMDSALMKAFGQAGEGLFPAPSVVETEVKRQYGADLVGVADGVVERFYAISVERKVRHPAIALICDAARSELFV